MRSFVDMLSFPNVVCKLVELIQSVLRFAQHPSVIQYGAMSIAVVETDLGRVVQNGDKYFLGSKQAGCADGGLDDLRKQFILHG